ncbi:hypothetical protein CFC21_052453 [Triticum aestivum]|uniref:Uncharacterized protein n=3 Tax=Triticum TaxID=4564 RepID=A0A9R0VZK4_TRITD|nr:hypothetical protein CFC21_052453 [Triticum aestivum]VAH91822.1 unnamed protein product [Triticum turgidum subsp. durum]
MSIMAKQTNSNRRQQGAGKGLSDEDAMGMQRSEGGAGAQGRHGRAEALRIELLSIQSMAAGARRRWRPDEIGSLGLHGGSESPLMDLGDGAVGSRRGRGVALATRCSGGSFELGWLRPWRTGR